MSDQKLIRSVEQLNELNDDDRWDIIQQHRLNIENLPLGSLLLLTSHMNDRDLFLLCNRSKKMVGVCNSHPELFEQRGYLDYNEFKMIVPTIYHFETSGRKLRD